MTQLHLVPSDENPWDEDLWMSESQLLAKVLILCQQLGLLVKHDYIWPRCTLGWPDLTIIGPRGFLIWELKSTMGVLSQHQLKWANMAKLAGMPYSVIKPRNWISGEAQDLLLSIADDPSEGLAVLRAA